ncbi:Putative ribonuclease/ribotoxin [Septoria linicola]|uniref:Ribonuclease/ribotoxin n=1 Tax=Septoria linicola TaxID=215465 RepID=A0A9Q9AQW3_9PEZI|nr:Putative ribonuclease/ribotoxin [Septoria linicola]
MYFSAAIASAILATSTYALAVPAPSSALLAREFKPLPDDPSMTPIDVKDLAQDATMTCGGTTFTYDDIYKAVQWGTILEKENLGRGKKSKEFPTGRFPHSYDSTQFSFSGNCPANGNRQEYPLIKDGPYNGGISNNVQWGDHRVVYYDNGEEAADANPIVYFCGGITHEGAPSKADFVQCTVN